MDVADQLAQVTVALAEDRLMSSLKNMPDPAITAVIILTVAGQDPLHCAAKSFILAFDQQVQVVRHQTIGIEVETRPLLLFGKQREKPLMVVAGMKNVPPVIATGDHMIKSTLNLDSSTPCHKS